MKPERTPWTVSLTLSRLRRTSKQCYSGPLVKGRRKPVAESLSSAPSPVSSEPAPGHPDDGEHYTAKQAELDFGEILAAEGITTVALDEHGVLPDRTKQWFCASVDGRRP
jgi:hypothetical protein